MRQSAFTILTDIKPGHVDAVTRLLDRIDADRGRDPLGFDRLGTVHFASLSILPGSAGPDDDRASLVFEGNIDGPTARFLRQLRDLADGTVDEIYRHCAGHPGESGFDLVRYLTAHDIGTNVFYVARPGRSVGEVRREDRLRTRIREFLDGPEGAALRGQSPGLVHAAIVAYVRGRRDLAWALDPAPVPFLVRNGRWIAGLAVAPAALGLLLLIGRAPHQHGARLALLAVAAGAAAVAGRLRSAEKRDDEHDRKRSPTWQAAFAAVSGRISEVREFEDRGDQNHLASVAEIKPGRFRRITLRAVLAAVQARARLVDNRGSLGGISSIHFARWTMTPDGRRLIFLSNYDGSWESYLNEFIDLASGGLTAVWTNTDNAVGFPATRWLTSDGARDEARFKAFARYGMVRTRVWYSAYPHLSVPNIANNMAIRRDLGFLLGPDETRTWLRRL
ncbi:hypothetical protein [Actinoplanes regularis]|uniref:WD40-like Beta Propeller Repeat n=1 Tax=Actinoplanes regularis TaxID=52697 RepID=A0A238YXF9_9ACTN|nr:hypothetical protein [Actinoplanes regularis]GIE85615.1 hypothetical protein Are01nite_20950 [Actinoplanes regularis]SNR75441.1 hypothetical protein SAMN06264365_105236 [Actinoplanes regularis]